MSLNKELAARPRGGMIVRSVEVLEPGLTLFKLGHRFVNDRRQSDLEIASSPWWFTQATVEHICQSSSRSNSPLSDTFRRYGAIAKRWGGTGDLVLKATLRSRVTAYIGPGTIQDFRNQAGHEDDNTRDLPLWVPSASIPQVHITLMSRGNIESSLAKEAFSSVFVVPIDKWDDSYVNGSPDGKWQTI